MQIRFGAVRFGRMAAKVKIPRVRFNPNKPHNIIDPLAPTQFPIGWTYTFMGKRDNE